MKYTVTQVVDHIVSVFDIEETEVFEGLNKASEVGLNRKGKLLDNLMEYSSYYKESGCSFLEMIKVMRERA
ncbi:hypothetical protein ACQKMI_10640 [Lysinibacillus sp. NPDC097214]|uniref:hypothetical protein n=1 Tax=Lysinibacillus sp. NPDC097214 TaxID=3390584 RepID=UPI003CFD3A09